MAYYFRKETPLQMFDWVLNTPLLPVNNKERNPVNNKEIIFPLYGPFLWVGFNRLKATEPLIGDSLVFTTQSRGVPGTHLFDLGSMKECGLPWSHPAVLNPDSWIGKPAP